MILATQISGNGGSLAAFASWLEGLIYSPVTTTVAVLAVAATGLSMLSGRMPVRRGLTAALGCFILFGAPAIARGIIGSATTVIAPEPSPPPPLPLSPPSPIFQPPPTAGPPAGTDPYAGASVR